MWLFYERDQKSNDNQAANVWMKDTITYKDKDKDEAAWNSIVCEGAWVSTSSITDILFDILTNLNIIENILF